MLTAIPLIYLETFAGLALLLLHIVASLAIILNQRRAPTATLAWLLVLAFLPGFGLVLYWLMGQRRMRVVTRESAIAAARMNQALSEHSLTSRVLDTAEYDAEMPMASERSQAMLKLGATVTSVPASADNICAMLVNAPQAYRAMLSRIEEAEHHVHVQFYIIAPDETGTALRDRLTRKATEGVQVRVIYDAIGSISLPSDFWQPLIEAGGQAAVFGPVIRLFHRLKRARRIDFRNHRKIVVVDGQTGFTGGLNIGREYLGLDPSIGHWRDTHMQIDGPAVLALQRAFGEDWAATTGELLEDAAFYPTDFPQTLTGAEARQEGLRGSHGCTVQIIDSGPDRQWSPITHLFSQAFTSAQQQLWLTTPYFIPSETIESAMIGAALRGVDVRLLVPQRADSWVVTLASRSYFQPMLRAGVKIYAYQKGFVHAKTIVIDDWMSTIGSANLDTRSFQLNFELNALIYSEDFAATMKNRFLQDLEQAQIVDADYCDQWGPLQRIAQASARLLSPLL